MNLLLNTHVLLWVLEGSRSLGRHVRKAIESPSTTNSISAASVWEISIKAGLGRLRLKQDIARSLPEVLHEAGYRMLPITMEHALAVCGLPPHHTDPFDRMLVAQAGWQGLTLVTADKRLAAYGAPTIDATE